MNHHASPAFWACYRALPAAIQARSDKAFELLKADLRHPSLRLKKIDDFLSVRIGLHHRALGVAVSDGVVWFWIGTHADYDKLVG